MNCKVNYIVITWTFHSSYVHLQFPHCLQVKTCELISIYLVKIKDVQWMIAQTADLMLCIIKLQVYNL